MSDEQFDKLKKEDTVWLLNKQKFFPDLAWRKVVEKLKTKTDIHNCSNASPFFGDLLQRKRETKVVLPTMFGILAKHYYNKKDESYEEPNVESIQWQRPEYSREPHKMTGLWKCRLVSKKWNKAIETIHRNEKAGHGNQTDCEFYETDNELIRIQWGRDYFDREFQVLKFLDHFGDTHWDDEQHVLKKCPFLGQHVCVSYSKNLVGNEQAYFNRLVKMFKKFGEQVLNFQFCWSSSELVYENVYIYRKLKEMVELMPNLNVFWISSFNKLELANEQLIEQDLEVEMQRYPFPDLAKLEMLSVGRIPGVLCNHLLNQNRQISRLEITSIDFYINCALFSSKFANLGQLSLVGMNTQFFEQFESCPFAFKLEKLQFRFLVNCPFVPWSRVFDAIESKLESEFCTDLELGMTRPTSDAERLSVLLDSMLCRLKFGNIQRFKVDSYAGFCLDFSLESKKSLREIEIRHSCDLAFTNGEKEEEIRDNQVIKFLGCEDNMQSSNIAKELPSLRKFRIWFGNNLDSSDYYIQPNGVIKVGEQKG